MTTQNASPHAKTDAEREEFGDINDAEEIEFEPPEKVGGRIGIAFTSDELDDLFAAARFAREDEISFIKRAAMERAAELLEQQPAAPAASS